MSDITLIQQLGADPCNCKKEIFAVHDRYISVPGVPVGAVAYEMTNDLPTQGLDVSNAYFHLIYPTLNGSQSVAYGPQLTDYFANVQNGILWSDIAGVQAVIDFVLPSMGLSVGDVVYAINTTNTPIFFLSPTAVSELANNTYLHIYWGDTDVHGSYNEKADVTVIAANPNILLGGEAKCVGIQEIKERDTCTGEETYRYVIEDLNGNLVKVESIYPDFVEADVLLECPPEPKIQGISEIEICINGKNAIQKTVVDSEGVELVTYYDETGTLPAPVTYTIGTCNLIAQRIHQNFVVIGTTSLVIPAGAISISVTKTNNTGIVNISGDNGTNFPLTFNRENFTDSVNEGYSTLSAYTITGTLAGTTYKVHIIR